MKYPIVISYDGKYPNFCRGNLTVHIGTKVWNFPRYCLSSGGHIEFDEEISDWKIYYGPWIICTWPTDFPENLKDAVTNAVNDQIPFGCCGGCI